MTSTDPFAHDDAAYLLGALGPEGRRSFEDHLRTCSECAGSVRDLAGVPGLLARLDEAAFLGPEDLPPLPDTMLPLLLRKVRHRRARVLGAVAAAVLVALVGTAAFLGRPSSETPPAVAHEMTQVSQHDLTASVALQPAGWGTRLHLACAYAKGWAAEPPGSYALVVRTKDGAAQQVATWRALPGGRTARLDAATEATQDQIASVEVVVLGTDQRVLTLDVASS